MPASPASSHFLSRRNAFAPGFTLIELLVAISVTSIMLLLVSRVFTETTRAINIGADTSQIVANSRTISDQMFQDAGRMNVAKANPEKDASRGKFSDEPGGFLVIIQQLNAGVRFPDPGRPGQAPEDWPVGDPIRTDQIAFIAAADKAESITPGSRDRYDSDAFAPYQRIWYGHVPRANLDGTLPDDTEVGQDGNNDDFDPTLVTDLVLGRQGLLIIDDQSLLPTGEEAYDTSSQTRNNIGNSVMVSQPVGFFRLNSRVDRLRVLNVDPGIPAGDDQYNEVHMGGTDLFGLFDPQNRGVDFANFFEWEGKGSDGAGGGGVKGFYATGHVFGTDRPDLETPNALNDPGNPIGLGTITPFDPAYPTDHTYLQPTELYQRHLLGWAFASPERRLVTSQDINYPYEPLDVARNHTFFVPYVSDFAVDFAADIVDDYTLADDPNTVQQNSSGATVPLYDNILLPWWDERFLPGPNQWDSLDATRTDDDTTPDVDERYAPGFHPDGLPDGRPDEYCIDPLPSADNNNNPIRIVGIKWYNMAFDLAQPGGQLGNPINVDPAFPSRLGTAVDRTRPSFYRLPRNFGAPSGTASPYRNFLAQIEGQYHTIPRPGSGSTGAIEYPPYVGYTTAGTPFLIFQRTPNVTTVSPTGSLPNNVGVRAVFVFGHTADYDLDGGEVNAGAFERGDGTRARIDGGNGFEAGSAKWWPYALRVRYRLHDGDGSYASVGEVPSATPVVLDPDQDQFDPIPGKWFEQVIPIVHHDNHRPDTN